MLPDYNNYGGAWKNYRQFFMFVLYIWYLNSHNLHLLIVYPLFEYQLIKIYAGKSKWWALYYMSQNKSARNPNFDHVLMEKIDTFINSNKDMFATLHDTPICDILNSPMSADEVSLALGKGKITKLPE